MLCALGAVSRPALAQTAPPFYFIVDGNIANGDQFDPGHLYRFETGTGGGSTSRPVRFGIVSASATIGPAAVSATFQGEMRPVHASKMCNIYYGCGYALSAGTTAYSTIGVYVRGVPGTRYHVDQTDTGQLSASVLETSACAGGYGNAQATASWSGRANTQPRATTEQGLGGYCGIPAPKSGTAPVSLTTTEDGLTTAPTVLHQGQIYSFAYWARTSLALDIYANQDPDFTATSTGTVNVHLSGYIVRPQQQPPTARIAPPAPGTAGTQVLLNGSGSSDPDGTLIDYRWEVSNAAGGVDVFQGPYQQIPYVWSTPGSYQVLLTVTDNDGQPDSDTATVVVRPQPPCTISIAPAARDFPVDGGFGAIRVTASDPTCQWTYKKADNVDWLNCTACDVGFTAHGSGIVSYTVAANSDTGPARVARIRIEDVNHLAQDHTVQQAGVGCGRSSNGCSIPAALLPAARSLLGAYTYATTQCNDPNNPACGANTQFSGGRSGTRACDMHDYCYGTYSGALSGPIYDAWKVSCDTALRLNALTTCRVAEEAGESATAVWNCRALAYAYGAGVGLFGDTILSGHAYADAQRAALSCTPSVTAVDGSIDSSGGAVSDNLFGSQAQLVVPQGAARETTDITISVQSQGTPSVAQAFGAATLPVTLDVAPALPTDVSGVAVSLPLANRLPAGTALPLYRIDESSRAVVAMVNRAGTPVMGLVDAGEYSARFGDLPSLPASVALVAALPDVGTPTNFKVTSVTSNAVSFAWTPGVGTGAVTGYVMEGGLTPGSVLGSLLVPHAGSTFTAMLPTGAFYVRLYALSGASRSAVSNEIRISVIVPAAPARPSNLLGLVNGSTIGLSWVNTPGGGAPAGSILEVSGALSASVPIPLTESFTFSGVPPGTYVIGLRAANEFGISPASDPVILTFPAPCSGPPLPPVDLRATQHGATVSASWSPPASGSAVAGYTLAVSGDVVASIDTSARSLSGTVGPGSYTLSVTATNACGTSAPSRPLTVTVTSSQN